MAWIKEIAVSEGRLFAGQVWMCLDETRGADAEADYHVVLSQFGIKPGVDRC